jgi:SAM-dependent methyltransferase
VDIVTRLERYLHSWGLRSFSDESSYYAWQRSVLSSRQLKTLETLIERRKQERQAEADIEFYQILARPPFLSVLYSQRYDYYLKLAPLICSKIPAATRVLDFGCGVGLLTTFWALEFPDVKFIGMDRSPQSIAVAEAEARARDAGNVSYQVGHVPPDPIPGSYDLIVSTHAVFQAEGHPGLPSMNWETFRRHDDPDRQLSCETAVGLVSRLDTLLNALRPNGRMIFFEKTAHLGRRILFQRALARRGLYPRSQPVQVVYHSLDEPVLDGPLVEVSRDIGCEPIDWDEAPLPEPGATLYRCTGSVARQTAAALLAGQPSNVCAGHSSRWGRWQMSLGVWQEALIGAYFETDREVGVLMAGGLQDRLLFQELFHYLEKLEQEQMDAVLGDLWGNFLQTGRQEGEQPGYENHHSTAQAIFLALPSKIVERQNTWDGPDGQAIHVEIGQTGNLYYLYFANTFDQRQLIVVESGQRDMLQTYYEESLQEMTF